MRTDATRQIGLDEPFALNQDWSRAIRHGSRLSQFEAAARWDVALRTLAGWELGEFLPDFPHTVEKLIQEVQLIASKSPIDMKRTLIGRILLAALDSEELMYVLRRYATLADHAEPSANTQVEQVA